MCPPPPPARALRSAKSTLEVVRDRTHGVRHGFNIRQHARRPRAPVSPTTHLVKRQGRRGAAAGGSPSLASGVAPALLLSQCLWGASTRRTGLLLLVVAAAVVQLRGPTAAPRMLVKGLALNAICKLGMKSKVRMVVRAEEACTIATSCPAIFFPGAGLARRGGGGSHRLQLQSTCSYASLSDLCLTVV